VKIGEGESFGHR